MRKLVVKINSYCVLSAMLELPCQAPVYKTVTRKSNCLEVPPPLSTYALAVEKRYFDKELLLEQEDVRVNALGCSYRLVGNCAYPAFFQASALSRLRNEFDARSNDVFLVFPSSPMLDELLACAIALVEQRPLTCSCRSGGTQTSSFCHRSPLYVDEGLYCTESRYFSW